VVLSKKKSHRFAIFHLFINHNTETTMPRLKESLIGTTELPNYKSPSSRIIRSLRMAYDNGRKKLAEKSKQIISLQGKLRDIENSRKEWKARAGDINAKLAKLEQENKVLKENLKKRG